MFFICLYAVHMKRSAFVPSSYSFSPWEIPGDDKPLYVLYMFRDLFHNSRQVVYTITNSFIHSFIHYEDLYSSSSGLLLKRAIVTVYHFIDLSFSHSNAAVN